MAAASCIVRLGNSSCFHALKNPSPGCKTLGCALVIILGIGGMVIAGLGLRGYLQVGSLSDLSQVHAIITMGVGGAGGILFLIAGIVGLVKNCQSSDREEGQPASLKHTTLNFGSPQLPLSDKTVLSFDISKHYLSPSLSIREMWNCCLVSKGWMAVFYPLLWLRLPPIGIPPDMKDISLYFPNYWKICVEEGRPLKLIHIYKESLSYDPDEDHEIIQIKTIENKVIGISRDYTVRVWDRNSGDLLFKVVGSPRAENKDHRVLVKNSLLVIWTKSGISIYDIEKGQGPYPIPGIPIHDASNAFSYLFIREVYIFNDFLIIDFTSNSGSYLFSVLFEAGSGKCSSSQLAKNIVKSYVIDCHRLLVLSKDKGCSFIWDSKQAKTTSKRLLKNLPIQKKTDSLHIIENELVVISNETSNREIKVYNLDSGEELYNCQLDFSNSRGAFIDYFTKSKVIELKILGCVKNHNKIYLVVLLNNWQYDGVIETWDLSASKCIMQYTNWLQPVGSTILNSNYLIGSVAGSGHYSFHILNIITGDFSPRRNTVSSAHFNALTLAQDQLFVGKDDGSVEVYEFRA